MCAHTYTMGGGFAGRLPTGTHAFRPQALTWSEPVLLLATCRSSQRLNRRLVLLLRRYMMAQLCGASSCGPCEKQDTDAAPKGGTTHAVRVKRGIFNHADRI